jgi:hypothetical protein
MFENFGLIFKKLCYVKDEGINLVNMTSSLTSIISCEALNLYNPFDGACFQHAMNKATQDVTNDDKISKDSANQCEICTNVLPILHHMAKIIKYFLILFPHCNVSIWSL